MDLKAGYIRNCYLAPREADRWGGPLFHSLGPMVSAKGGYVIEGACIPYLDGYAIIPIEEYKSIVPEKFKDVA